MRENSGKGKAKNNVRDPTLKEHAAERGNDPTGNRDTARASRGQEPAPRRGTTRD